MAYWVHEKNRWVEFTDVPNRAGEPDVHAAQHDRCNNGNRSVHSGLSSLSVLPEHYEGKAGPGPGHHWWDHLHAGLGMGHVLAAILAERQDNGGWGGGGGQRRERYVAGRRGRDARGDELPLPRGARD